MRPRAISSAIRLGTIVGALAACASGCRGAETETKPPAGMIGIEARFGKRVDLAGYTLEPRTLLHRAGSRVAVGLVWRVDEPLDEGYRPFAHLYDARGRMLENLDDARAAEPWAWTPGSTVIDRVEVPVPAHGGDTVTLAVGFFRGAERLPAEGGGVDPRANAAIIRLSVAGASAAGVPSLSVPRLTANLAIDGRLDEEAWARAGRTGPFVEVTTGRAARGPLGASARLFHDERFLYLGIEVADTDLEGGFSGVDPHLWTKDTVELMIDPEGDGDNRDYFEIQIGPQNLVFDSRFDDYNAPRGGPDGPFGHQDWTARIDSAVELRGSLDDGPGDEGYTVEARLPFESLGRSAPGPGERWRVNLYALERGRAVSWSPILGQGNFHRAARFGRVSFVPAKDSSSHHEQ